MASSEVPINSSDAHVVARIKGGDASAWEDVFDRYADRMYTLSFSVLRSDEAADATQDAFVIAIQHIGSLRDPAALRPWLLRIAWTESLRRARQRVRSTTMTPIVGDISPDPGPDLVAQQRELQHLVGAAAAGLPDEDRVVLELSAHQGLKGEELAQALGVSTSYARKLAQRVRKRADRAVGALLVATHGRGNCSELAGLLTTWDGTFSPLIRKRVARHIDRCVACSRQRSEMTSPVALLGATPLMAAPQTIFQGVHTALTASVAPGAFGAGSTSLHLASLAPSRVPQAIAGIAIGGLIVGVALLLTRPTAGPITELAGPGNRDSLEIAVDGGGHPLVTWVDYTIDPFATMARAETDAGWSDQVNLTEGFVNPGSATFRTEPDGTMCAFFHGIVGTDWLHTYGLYQRCWTGTDWSPARQVTRIGDDDDYYLTTKWSPAFDASGRLQTAFNTPPGTTGFAGDVLSGPGVSGNPMLLADSADRLHLVWYNAETGNMDHRWSDDGGDTWFDAVPVAPYAATELAADRQGGIHVTSAIDGEVRYRRWTAEGGWGETLDASGDARSYITYGGLAATADGRAVVAWTNDDGLVVSEADASGRFGDAMPVVVGPTVWSDIDMVRVAVSGDHLHAAWITGDGEVVYQRLR